MASLVGVQYLRSTVLGHRLANHSQAGLRRQGVGYAPVSEQITVEANQPILIFTTEKVAAVRHCDGIDW